MKVPIKQVLLISAILAVIFTFVQDFLLFDYTWPRAVITDEVLIKIDNMLHKDAIKYIADHTKKHSVYDGIKYLLSQYRYFHTWQYKTKTFILYFFAIFIGCSLIKRKLKQ